MKGTYFLIRLRAFKNASFGIKKFFGEDHARIHLISSALVVIFSIFLKLNSLEWIAVLGCCTLVICLEAINSSIERLTDVVSPEWNEKAGLVKDIAAGSVLLAALFSLLVGCIIFLPKILNLL